LILKILVLAIVLVLVYFLFFKKTRKDSVEDKRREDLKSGEETMVECKKCDTYISTKEAIIKNNEYYCSKECAGV
jgi:uncharacterized protein